MREEDEIRAAVVALMEAQEAGEDATAELPDAEAAERLRAAAQSAAGEAGGEGAEADPEQVRAQAVGAVLAAVRNASRDGRLSQPAEWSAAGLVPECLTDEDVEMAVYDRVSAYLASEEGQKDAQTAAQKAAGDKAVADASARPVNKHVKSAFSSSNGRTVGAPAFKRRAKPAEEPEAAEETVQVEEVAASDEPAAAESVKKTPSPFADCKGIALLMGATSYYLYDRMAMTDSFARWAFLAAEDDPVATFTECVREESSVYPRPMARTNLGNNPFNMTETEVEEAFAAAREQGRADDIERIEASNGDVYFFSTTYLTPQRAQALAEWHAVERKRNV